VSEVRCPVERIDEPALVGAAGVYAALFGDDRRAGRCGANPFDDQLLAFPIGFGYQIAAPRLLFIMKMRSESRE
jgi:hypothetical protein